MGLVELPSVERAGFLWVHPRRDGTIDVPALLGELDDELRDWNVGAHVFSGERRLVAE